MEAQVRKAIGQPSGDIEPEDVRSLTRLDASVQDVTSLQGVECLAGLTELDVSSNPIEDISPLAQLPRLEISNIGRTLVADYSALGAMTQLAELNMRANTVSDLSPLAALEHLCEQGTCTAQCVDGELLPGRCATHYDCAPDEYCQGTNFRCAPRPRDGAPCVTAGSICVAGQRCHPSRGCVPLLHNGADCSAGAECSSGYCFRGTCAPKCACEMP